MAAQVHVGDGVMRGASTRPSAQESPAGQQTDGRPNIITIILDDMRADDLDAMPAVQSQLAAQGSRFQNCIVAAPLCAPARASILRGQYAHNHGILRGNGVNGGFRLFRSSGQDSSTIATWLQAAGYRTALFGKYLNGYLDDEDPSDSDGDAYIPPGWDEWVGMTETGYFRFVVNDGGELKQFRTGKKRQYDEKRMQRTWYTPKGRVRYSVADKKHPYSTDVFAGRALDFVKRTARGNQPFFMYVAPFAVHGPAEPAVRHATASNGAMVPRTAAFNEADVSDKPTWVQQSPLLSESQAAELDSRHAARRATLLAVDEFVQSLIDRLAQERILDNTYIVLSSDHGFLLGEHRLAAKGVPYEQAINVPLVMRGPTVPAGAVIDQLVSQVDLAPTFAGWAEAATPSFVDGRSLTPLLQEARHETQWREHALVEHYRRSRDDEVKSPGFCALRGDRFVYVEYQPPLRPGAEVDDQQAEVQPAPEPNSTVQRELYDLTMDPLQLLNLIRTAEPALVESFSKKLASMRTCRGASCRETEVLAVDPSLVPTA
jgi:N-acetylglucosamine-6-sulfatase